MQETDKLKFCFSQRTIPLKTVKSLDKGSTFMIGWFSERRPKKQQNFSRNKTWEPDLVYALWDLAIEAEKTIEKAFTTRRGTNVHFLIRGKSIKERKKENVIKWLLVKDSFVNMLPYLSKWVK